MTNIHPDLLPLAEPIDRFQPYPGNARIGSVGLIEDSLREVGQYRPIVVNRPTMHILVGNHTHKAAKDMGWDQIAVTYVDVDEDLARRMLLADNRTSDLGAYDDTLLLNVVEAAPDLTGTGYSDALVTALRRVVRDGETAVTPPAHSPDDGGVVVSMRIPPVVMAAWNERAQNADSAGALLAELVTDHA